MESARIASPNLLALNRLAAAAGVAVASFSRVLLDAFGRVWARKKPRRRQGSVAHPNPGV